MLYVSTKSIPTPFNMMFQVMPCHVFTVKVHFERIRRPTHQPSIISGVYFRYLGTRKGPVIEIEEKVDVP